MSVAISLTLTLTLTLMVVFPRTGGERTHGPEQMVNPFYFGMFVQPDQDSYVDYMLGNLHQDQQARPMLLEDI